MTRGRRAVVTGASTGIGCAVVHRLRADGWRVVGVARRADRLAQLAAESGCEYVAADLTTEEGAAAVARVAGNDIGALVNVAGGAIGLDAIAEFDAAAWARMIDVNVIATARLTATLLPALRAGATPGSPADIVTVTSVAASMAYPGGGGYVTAKHAERAFVDVLRLELASEPVRVSEVAPGTVATEEFWLNRFRGDAAEAERVRAANPDALVADDVAEAVGWMLGRPARVAIPSLQIVPAAPGGGYTAS